jgi:hypothetical protein
MTAENAAKPASWAGRTKQNDYRSISCTLPTEPAVSCGSGSGEHDVAARSSARSERLLLRPLQAAVRAHLGGYGRQKQKEGGRQRDQRGSC